jgi:hypothetical protein
MTTCTAITRRLWTVRQLELGRHAFEIVHPSGVLIRLEVFDGGGFVGTVGMWRFAGKLVRIEEAGEG